MYGCCQPISGNVGGPYRHDVHRCETLGQTDDVLTSDSRDMAETNLNTRRREDREGRRTGEK